MIYQSCQYIDRSLLLILSRPNLLVDRELQTFFEYESNRTPVNQLKRKQLRFITFHYCTLRALPSMPCNPTNTAGICLYYISLSPIST